MATQATAQILAKGPLSSALGQWIFLGLGTFVIFTGNNGVSDAAKEIASLALRMVTGRDELIGAALLREAALSNQSALQPANASGQSQHPIIIHSLPNTRSLNGKGWTATIVQMSLAAGACWTAYVVFVNFLPDEIKGMLPVTRKFFESAVTSLGQGILRVRDVLSQQIAALKTKQDELGTKQDKTHDQVLGLKDDVGDVRLRIDDIAVAISRCENSLGDAAGRQTYTSRGVRLLVQSVGDLLRPSNPAVAEELDQFSRMSAEMMDDDFRYKEGSKERDIHPSSSSSTNKRLRQQLDYPSSPNLSEIGSTTSAAVDDHHHVSFSLPPRQSQSIVTPSSSSPRNKAQLNNAYIATTQGNVASPSPASFLGMSPPPGGLKMFQSFSSRNNASNAAPTSASSNIMDSSPENEVPQSNSAQATHSGTCDVTDLKEVNELLMSIGRRGRSIQTPG